MGEVVFGLDTGDSNSFESAELSSSRLSSVGRIA